jgi:hypothetical protein
MKRPSVILLILSFVFVFAQCASIAQATDVLANLVAEEDNIDDISLDEVVYVDPFLSTAPFKSSEQHYLLISYNPALINIPATETTYVALDQQRRDWHDTYTLTYPGSRLWLLHRTLLI